MSSTSSTADDDRTRCLIPSSLVHHCTGSNAHVLKRLETITDTERELIRDRENDLFIVIAGDQESRQMAFDYLARMVQTESTDHITGAEEGEVLPDSYFPARVEGST